MIDDNLKRQLSQILLIDESYEDKDYFYESSSSTSNKLERESCEHDCECDYYKVIIKMNTLYLNILIKEENLILDLINKNANLEKESLIQVY